MKYKTMGVVVLVGLVGRVFPAAEKSSVFRGEIRMTMQNGGTGRVFRYRYTETRLRIDRPGEVIPSPRVNLLDLEKGLLCIIHPHNGTWEQNTVGGVAAPILHIPGSPIPAVTRMAPPADWPEMPGMPGNLPEGIGPASAQSVGAICSSHWKPDFQWLEKQVVRFREGSFRV